MGGDWLLSWAGIVRILVLAHRSHPAIFFGSRSTHNLWQDGGIPFPETLAKIFRWTDIGTHRSTDSDALAGGRGHS